MLVENEYKIEDFHICPLLKSSFNILFWLNFAWKILIWILVDSWKTNCKKLHMGWASLPLYGRDTHLYLPLYLSPPIKFFKIFIYYLILIKFQLKHPYINFSWTIFTNQGSPPPPTLKFIHLHLLFNFGEILYEKSFKCQLKIKTKLKKICKWCPLKFQNLLWISNFN